MLSENSIDEDVDVRLDWKHENMLRFLNDDFSRLDLDLEESIFGLEREGDFEQVLKHLKKDRN